MLCKNISSSFIGSDFEKDLAESVLLTPLRSMIFPIDDRGGIKTVSYTELEDNYLQKPVHSSKFVGLTFDAHVNTYFHSDNAAGMCVVECIEWKNKPLWFNRRLTDQLIEDANSKNLRVQNNSLPIFFIVSRKEIGRAHV